MEVSMAVVERGVVAAVVAAVVVAEAVGVVRREKRDTRCEMGAVRLVMHIML